MTAIDDLLDRGRDARRRRDEAAHELAAVLQALEGLAGVELLDATALRCYDDEVLFCEGDLIGKTAAELRTRWLDRPIVLVGDAPIADAHRAAAVHLDDEDPPAIAVNRHRAARLGDRACTYIAAGAGSRDRGAAAGQLEPGAANTTTRDAAGPSGQAREPAALARGRLRVACPGYRISTEPNLCSVRIGLPGVRRDRSSSAARRPRSASPRSR